MIAMYGKNRYLQFPGKLPGAGFLFIGVLFFLLASQVAAGVLVAPTVVIMSDKSRTGRIMVDNPSNTPKQIAIYFSFGLPQSDSLGKIHMDLQDSNVTDPRSALGWIKAFPRKIVLPANGSQVVRLVARPPKNIADGEYWAHIVIESQEGETTLPTSTETEGITTKLNMIMRTVIALKYRTGDLYARLDMTDFTARQIDSTVEVLLDLSNRGNVSYLGTLTCKLLDAENRQISFHKSNIAVYRDLRRGIFMPIKEGNFKKPFQIEVAITGEGRTDIPRVDMVFGNEITRSYVLE